MPFSLSGPAHGGSVLRENAKSRPSFAMDQGPFKDRIREFFQTEEQERRWLPAYKDHDSRQMANMAHLEAMEDGSFLLFDYKERDPLWKNARTLRFTYEETCAGTERGEYERIKEGQSRTGGTPSWRGWTRSMAPSTAAIWIMKRPGSS